MVILYKNMKEDIKKTLTLPCSMAALVAYIGIDEKPNIMAVGAYNFSNNGKPRIEIFVKSMSADKLRKQYSFESIANKKEFTLNIPSSNLAYHVDFCGSVSGNTYDKFAISGLTAIPSKIIRTPSIAECPVSLECSVYKVTQQKGSIYRVFSADVLNVRVLDRVVFQNKFGIFSIDWNLVNPLLFFSGIERRWAYAAYNKPTVILARYHDRNNPFMKSLLTSRE
jgi:flavin reductase (DIM6/NTAB) family NADH-FMN oxidoreductase RutF